MSRDLWINGSGAYPVPDGKSKILNDEERGNAGTPHPVTGWGSGEIISVPPARLPLKMGGATGGCPIASRMAFPSSEMRRRTKPHYP